MAVYINTTFTSGRTLFATIKRLSDGYFWSVAASAFQAAPTLANKKITLTEGSSEYAGSYGGSVSSLISPGEIVTYIHDDGLAGDTVVGLGQSYVSVSDERAPADLLRWKGSTPSDIHFTGSVQANVVYWQGLATSHDGTYPNVTAAYIGANVVDGSALADSARDEIRTAIVGGNYALQTDGSGYIKISNGTGTGQLSLASGVVAASVSTLGTSVVTAAALATDAVEEIRNAVTGGAYALQTDGSGYVKVSSGTGTGQIDLTSGVANVAVASLAANSVTASALATDAVQEIRDAVTGYAGSLQVDGSGYIKVSSGTGTGQISLASGVAAASLGTDAISAASVSSAAANKLADALLSRDVSNVEGSAGVTTVAFLILASTESNLGTSLWTIYRTDGSTEFATRTIGRTDGNVTSIS